MPLLGKHWVTPEKQMGVYLCTRVANTPIVIRMRSRVILICISDIYVLTYIQKTCSMDVDENKDDNIDF